MNNCRNCNEPVQGNFCSNCGQPAKLKRIDGNYVIREIGNFLFANKGLIYTSKKMLFAPGESVRLHIAKDRTRFVKPITFLFIMSVIYTIFCHLFQFDAQDFYIQQPEIELPTLSLFVKWMTDYPGYSSIISGFFVAFFVKLFFRKSGYNLFEIFILLCFLSGISSLISIIPVIVKGLTQFNLLNLSTFVVFIYYAWAIGQFFDKNSAKSYVKAFMSCVLGFLVFGILVAIVAVCIDTL
jgi:hypothetical protein